MADGDSVTTWIGLLRAGESVAAQSLWERYFARLLAVARAELAGTSRRAADEEDVALSAFHSFVRAAEAGRFPRLNDRSDLWQLLVLLTARKAFQERRRQWAAKRGGTAENGARRTAAVAEPSLDELIGREPDPALAAELADHFAHLLKVLPDDEVRRVARLRLEGRTAAEIAAAEGCGVRTVERKLALIRGAWERAVGADQADPANS